MSHRIESRTVTVPVKVWQCSKCQREAVEAVDSLEGWICCHELSDTPSANQDYVPSVPDQHLCNKCKHLVAVAVADSTPDVTEIARLRAALERIYNELKVGTTTGPQGIALIAAEALAGREAPTSKREREPAPGPQSAIREFLSRAISEGRAQFIPISLNPTDPSKKEN